MTIAVDFVSMVIFLPSTESFKKGCCQLQAKVYTQSTMTIAVDLGRTEIKQVNKTHRCLVCKSHYV